MLHFFNLIRVWLARVARRFFADCRVSRNARRSEWREKEAFSLATEHFLCKSLRRIKWLRFLHCMKNFYALVEFAIHKRSLSELNSSLASAGGKEILRKKNFCTLGGFAIRKHSPRTFEIFLNTHQTQTPASLGSLMRTLLRSSSAK